jgi:hypothetical protein
MEEVGRIVLEMSLKPFKKVDQSSITAVCRQVLQDWYPLLGIAGECSILFWIADGSEILTWKGDLEEPIEWARYIGFCNADKNLYSEEDRSRERVASYYVDNPPVITYGLIRQIIATFKQLGREYGLDLTAGATFDPGPEFAYSDFKYNTHFEIIGGGVATKIGPTFAMVNAWSSLRADQNHYATYPAGMPDDTPFGVFFGKQCRSFLSALGFDYIWFSNGFGFSHFPWTCLGENFDGTKFNTVNYREQAGKVLSFWEHFRENCPDFPVEVRGTNFGAGMDLAKDCIPLKELYEGGFMRAPACNSPWGPLNNDYGLELVGHMSRIAELPGDVYPFRFYPNDPWFWQNPWWDWYGREPFDIYTVMSVARLSADGEIENPEIIEFLTIDTEKGELNELCPLEVIPHVRRAIQDKPNQPGILTWLYPFDEYFTIAKMQSERMDLVFFGDWFVRGAVNNGLPLNTVISTGSFKQVWSKQPGLFRETILFVPTVADESCWNAVREFVTSGGRAIIYGPLDFAPVGMRSLLDIELDQGIAGNMVMKLPPLRDQYVCQKGNQGFYHDPLISGGDIREVMADTADGYTEMLASVEQGTAQRAYALVRQLPAWQGGKVAWVRGSNPFTVERKPDEETRLPKQYDPWYFDATHLPRYLLSYFGYEISHVLPNQESKRPLLLISRRDNGFYFSGYKADMTVDIELAFPDGAPILSGKDAWVKGGTAVYSFGRTIHDECRVFVHQSEPGAVYTQEQPPFPTGRERMMRVSNLKDAAVAIYPPGEKLETTEINSHPEKARISGVVDHDKCAILLENITGAIDIVW